MRSQDLRPGVVIELDRQLWRVTELRHLPSASGQVDTEARLRHVATGQLWDKRFTMDQQLQEVQLERRPLEYLYGIAGAAVFMDSQTFEQVNVSDTLLGDARCCLKHDTVIVGLFRDGQLVGTEPPPEVELEVTETPPGVRSTTLADQIKDATCETGLRTRVPAFVNTGDVIRVSTATGEYLGRKN